VAFVLELLAEDDEPLRAAGLLAAAETAAGLLEVCACPFTADVAGCTGVAAGCWAVAWPGCANSYAIAPPKPSVAAMLTVMKTSATLSRMCHLPGFGGR
jgi:hypothetical protein